MTGGDSGRGKAGNSSLWLRNLSHIPRCRGRERAGRTTADQDGPSDLHRGRPSQHA